MAPCQISLRDPLCCSRPAIFDRFQLKRPSLPQEHDSGVNEGMSEAE